jgi:hypothetical protein
MMQFNAAIAMPKRLSMEACNSFVLSGKRAIVKRKRQPNLEVVAAHNHIGGFQPTQAFGAHRRRHQEKTKAPIAVGFRSNTHWQHFPDAVHHNDSGYRLTR